MTINKNNQIQWGTSSPHSSDTIWNERTRCRESCRSVVTVPSTDAPWSQRHQNFGPEGHTSSYVIMTKLFKALWKVRMSVLMTNAKINFYEGKGKGKGKGLVVRYPLLTFLNLSSCDSARFLTSSLYARPSESVLNNNCDEEKYQSIFKQSPLIVT